VIRRPVWLGAAVVAATFFGVLAAVVVARSGAPWGLDSTVHHWAVTHRTAALTEAAVVVTSTGTGVIAYVLAAAAGALGGGRRHWWRGAIAAAVALALCQAARFGIAEAIHRMRPPRADWARTASGFAFPSGHTTTAAGISVLICVALTRCGTSPGRTAGRVLAIAWAAAVGGTRVYLGVHWPTDVLGGWLLVLALSCGAWGLAGRRVVALLLGPAS
jgi:membrane-associated phospholipid phosphatase